MKRARLEWDGNRDFGLGRHVNHDPRSKKFPARGMPGVAPSRLWSHAAPVLNQGQLGSCTGNAMAQLLNCAVMRLARRAGQDGAHDDRYLDEEDAVRLYSTATTLDDWDGSYPPEDTGSSGLSVSKAAQGEGFITGYTHVFGMTHFLQVIPQHPLIVGTNWYASMDDPNSDGFVGIAGEPVGGHEYLCIGVNFRDQYLTFLNSWGDGWGLKGRFRIEFPDFARLLSEDGDATLPIGAVPTDMKPADA